MGLRSNNISGLLRNRQNRSCKGVRSVEETKQSTIKETLQSIELTLKRIDISLKKIENSLGSIAREIDYKRYGINPTF